MAAVTSIVVLLILAVSAGLLHIPVVRDFALEKSRRYLVENQNVDVEADKLDYNLFTLTSTLHNVRVRSTEEPDEPPFFVADRIHVNLELGSLLRGKLGVEEGSVEGGRIEIVYDAEGRSNLPKPVERPGAQQPEAANGALPFLLRNFSASGPLIRFADQAADLELTLPQWTLSIDGDAATQNHRIQFGIGSQGDLDYQDRSLPLNTVTADVDFRPDGLGVSRVVIEPGASRIELTGEVADMKDSRLDLRASIQANGEELAGFAGLDKPISGQFDVDAGIRNRPAEMEITARVTGREVTYGEFRDAALATTLTCAAGTGRVGVESFEFSGPFGGVSGTADVALNEAAGLSRANVRLSRFNLLTASREFDSPIAVASRATGSVEMSWTAMEFTNLAGAGNLSLAATRSAPAKDVLPASGRLQFQMADERVEANLRNFEALGARVSGAVTVADLQRLGGAVGIEVADMAPTISQLDAFLGRPEGDSVVPTTVSGPLTASIDLGGAIDNPAIRMQASSDRLRAGEIENVAFKLEGAYAGSTLTLDDLALVWNNQRAAVQGSVALAGESPSLDLQVQAQDVVIADAMDLLGRTEPVSGIASFNAEVTGTATAPQVTASLTARELNAYGELWGDLSANASVSGSRIELTNLDLQKPQPEGDGSLSGSAAYDLETKEYALDIQSSQLRLTTLALPSGEPVRGAFDIRASGQGTVADPALEASVSASELTVGDQQIGELAATASVAGGLARLNVQAPKYKLDAEAETGLEAPYPASFRAAIDGLDLATLGVEARPGEPLRGAVTGVVEGSGEIDNWQDGTLTVNFEQAEVGASAVTLRNDGPWRLSVSDRRLRVESFAVLSGESQFSIEGEMPFDASQPAGELRVAGAFNLDVVPGMLGNSVDPEAFLLGVLEMNGAVRGSFERVQPDVDLKIDRGVIFTPEMLYPVVAIQMDAHVDSSRVDLRSFTAEYSQGQIQAQGSMPFGVIASEKDLPLEVKQEDGPARFQASLTGLNLEELGVIPDGGGRVSVEFEAQAPRLALQAMAARLTVPELSLQVRDLQIGQAEPITLAIENSALRIDSFHLSGPQTDIRATGGAELTGDRPANIRVDGTTDAGIVSYLVEDLRMSGPAELHASVTGPLGDPDVNGTFTLSEGTFSLPSPRLDSERLDVALRFDSQRLEIERLEGALNGGTFQASGGLQYTEGIRDVDVKIDAQGIFMDFPEDLRTLSNADLRFHSVENELVRLDGTLTIEDGSFTERLDIESQVMTFLNSTDALDFVDEPHPFLSRIRYDIAVDSENPILVDNNIARLESTVDLRVVGTYYRPSLLGRVILEEGGEVTLAENRYVIENGLIEFTSEARIRPSLNLQARTDVAGYDIILRATGTGGEIDTQFTSEPSLPEPDVISLLLTGRTLEQARESGLNIAREQALSYLTGSLGGRIGSAAQEGLGLTEVRIEPNLISAEEDPSARLTIGQRITRQLNLIYSMNLTDSGDQIFVTEYDITRRFQVKAVKQSDNSHRGDFRHDIRWGLENEPERRRRRASDVRVGEVAFDGDLRMSREQAMDVLGVKPGDKYDFFKSRKKVDKLTKAYQEQGRLEARVRVNRERRDGIIDLRYQVEPGPLVDFSFQPASVPGDVQQQVREAWSAGVFDLQRQDDSEAVLLEWLYKEGYLQAEVESEVAIIDADRERAQFLVRPGVQFTNVELVFEGNSGIPADTLELVLERTNLLDRMRAEPREVAETLVRYYYQRGYLAAEIERPRYDLEPDTAAGRVVIAIDEGPLFTIGVLTFPGVEAFTEQEIRAIVNPVPGGPYTPEYLGQALRKVEDLYWTKGYNDVLVNFELTRNRDTATVDIKFDITENDQDIIQDIRVAGNERVSGEMIRSRLVSESGDLMLADKNELSRKRLYDTGAFSLVDLETAELESVDAAPRVNPLSLTVRVREVSPYQLRYGAFYDTERGVGAITDFEARNVIGAARSVGARLRYDSDFREARTYFNQPLLMGLPLKTTSALFRSRELESTFITDRTGVSVQQEIEMGREYILQYGYRFEKTHTFDNDPDAFIPLDIRFNLAPFTATFTHDSRDAILDATRGNFYSHAFEYAPSAFGSDVRYFKYFGQYFRYKGFFTPDATPFDEKRPRPKVVWAGGVRAGISNGLAGQEIVPSERFFAGGGTTVRGFKQDELGPKAFGDTPEGGEAVFILNQELRFPLVSIFEGVGFIDLGNVYSQWDEFDPTNVRAAGGFGLRLRTPWFLIRADYGFKLDRQPGESMGAFFFSIGQAF